MAAIGTISVSVWKGVLVPSVYGFQLYEQGGMNGYGVVFGGKKAPIQNITTITRIGTTTTDYLAAETAYRATMVTLQSLTDQFGRSWPYTLVVGVTCQQSADPLGYIMTANWQFLVQAT